MMEDVRIGEVVWAKVSGYPWWPATISRNLDKKTWKRKDGKVWVNFFNDPQGAWIAQKTLAPFEEGTVQAHMVKPTHRSFRIISEAVEEASAVVKKQREEGVEVTAAEPEELIALAEGRPLNKRSRDSADDTPSTTPTPKRSKARKSETKSSIRDSTDEIVPAVEETKKAVRTSSRRRVKTSKASLASEETDLSEDEEPAPEVPQKRGRASSGAGARAAATASPPATAASNMQMKRLESQVESLQADLKRAKDEIRSLKAAATAKKEKEGHAATVPPVQPKLEFELPEVRGKETVTKDELDEELKRLKAQTVVFEEMNEDAADHRKVAGELASKFNAKVRALNNAEMGARKAEFEVVRSLSQLLKWAVPVTMLKQSHAGKPVRKVEQRCGKHSEAISTLAKTLKSQWMLLLNETRRSVSSSVTSESASKGFKESLSGGDQEDAKDAAAGTAPSDGENAAENGVADVAAEAPDDDKAEPDEDNPDGAEARLDGDNGGKSLANGGDKAELKEEDAPAAADGMDESAAEDKTDKTEERVDEKIESKAAPATGVEAS